MRIALDFVEEVNVKLRKLGFTLRNAYIIGSRARGDYTEESDIDIVLVIDEVKTLNTLERLNLIKDMLKPKLNVIVYSTEDWCKEISLWIKELKKEAVPIHLGLIVQKHYIDTCREFK